MTREEMAKRLLIYAAQAVGLPPGDLDGEDDETRDAVLALADAALAECAKAAEEAYREAWVEGSCESQCDCETCNTSPDDAYKSSDTRKKWAKEDK